MLLLDETGASGERESDGRTGSRAADALVGEIEQRIAAGDLADGAPLPTERDLMSRFGTSRTVVREAIARLASRGLVESRPRHRPVVRRPGYDAAISAVGGVVGHLLRQPGGVKSLFDTRIFLEAALVRHAALHARKDDVTTLREALEANRAAIEDSLRFYETDVAFHAVFYRIPRNPVFPAIHLAFTEWLSEHWTRMPRSPERNRVNHASHREIFDGIVDRDPDAAERALTGHLAAAWGWVRETFED